MRTRAFFGGSVATVAVAFVAAAAGCSSSSSGDSKDDEQAQAKAEAREFYVSRVHPAAGTCVGCHSGGGAPQFMAQDPEASYAALEKTVGLISAPKNSPLVQYIHKDPAIVIGPEQRSVVSQWLSLEATARGLEGAIPKAKTVTEAYQQFADCMNFDVWTYYRMGDLAFNQTDTEGPCLGCHSSGQGSAWLSAGSRETFDRSKQFPYIQKLVVGRLNDKGSFESLAPSNRFAEKANEVCPPESTSCHPRFGLSPNVADGIKNYVNATLQNLATGQCQNGIVVPQSDGGVKDAGGG